MAAMVSAAERGTRLVIGAGDGMPAARVFASATGRALVRAKCADDVVGRVRRGGGSITISMGSGLDVRQLHQLACAAVESDTRIGFIAGWGGARDAARHAEKLAR